MTMKRLALTMAAAALILVGCASAPLASQPPNVQATVDAQVQATVQAMAPTAAPTMKPATPTVPIAPPTAAPTATPTAAKWNTSNMNALLNGNLSVAAKLITANGVPQDGAKTASPPDVAKAPWKYFGDIYKFTGVVALVQEYPPDGPESKILIGGGPLAEIVMMDPKDSTSTPIDFMFLSGTRDIQKGDTVTAYGYVTGVAEVPNRLGGTTQQLIVMGKEPLK